MEDLVRELEAVQVVLPEDPIDTVRKTAVPESYKSNSKKEQLIISYADNFKRQFKQLYGDRKALFLSPTNEFNVEKFICTTIRPTHLPYHQLYDYDGASSFVADYITYNPLIEPCDLPASLSSPTHVLEQQKGNCFEMSVLLCSLLIGVGYDAYCVCGYASRGLCLMDQTRRTCPLLQEKDELKEAGEPPPKLKYAVHSHRDLKSKFELRLEDKEKEKMEKIRQQQREEDLAVQAERELPPPDEILGLRFHCWVLVLAGEREVPLNFFIEATSGQSRAVDDPEYLGIESLWNHKNYWVNMQDCATGVQNLVYDLGDSLKWEYFFPNVGKPLLMLPSGDDSRELLEGDEEEETLPKDDIDLPPTWVSPLHMSQRDFETRCPKGKKTILYKRAKVEKFAEYLSQDGLVTTLSKYKNLELTEKVQIAEHFKHRQDCLDLRETACGDSHVVESFSPGRPRALKTHSYYTHSPGPESTRTMSFYSDARVDGLLERGETPLQMRETFKNRDDRLLYKEVNFGKPTKKFGPSDPSNRRSILSIIERFDRDLSSLANNDVYERRFNVSDNTIKLTYHRDAAYITASTREFELPTSQGDQSLNLTFHPDLTSGYQVDPYVKSPKKRVLFDMLESLVLSQEQTCVKARQSEQEVKDILDARSKEEAKPVLGISVYDVARNETAKKHRIELERKQAEEERLRKEKEMDYLAPYLARLGEPENLTYHDKQQLKADCLRDLRVQLVDMANIIQTRFEEETSSLQKKQQWYTRRISSLSRARTTRKKMTTSSLVRRQCSGSTS